MTFRSILSLSAITLSVQGFATSTKTVNPVVPIGFEPNRGQFSSEYLYSARAGSYRLDLGPSTAHMVLQKQRGSVELRSSLLGANSAARFEALEPLASHASYFRGADPSQWQTDVPQYGRVRQVGVYPGIDLVYYGNPSRLEYDFVVAPGADAKVIQMRFDGARTVRVDRASGDLVIATAAGEVRQQRPVAYQQVAGARQRVDGQFVVNARGDVSFALGAYDHAQPLVIDPTVGFISFLGTGDLDQGNAIAMDRTGNFYIAGTTYNSGNANILLRKFSPTGQQLFVADLGGSGDDTALTVKVAQDGTIYVGGRTNSSNFPLVNAFQRNRGGGYDAFIMRLDTTGKQILYSTYLGGNADDQCRSLVVDGSGNVVATGTAGADFPTMQGGLQTTSRGGKDAFIVKLDPQGNRVFSTLLGGGGDDEGAGVALDNSGNVYVTGTTESDNFPQINNPFQHSKHGDVDAFVTELSSAGNAVVYSTFLGGRGSDQPFGIFVDANGSAFIAGKTGSGDFPTTNNVFQGDYAGGDNDIFVTKFTPGQGGLVYSTLIGTNGNDEGFGLTVDNQGNAYVVGNTDSNQYPITRDAVQRFRGGNRDAVITVLNPQGRTVVFSTYLGGTFNDAAYGIALDGANNVYVTGVTYSADFPTSTGAFQSVFGGSGNADAFFAQLVFNAVPVGTPTVNNSGIVNGANFAQGGVAPGSVISIFGNNFVATPVSATSVPLPTTLGGVQVLVNGTPAPLYYVGTTQINAQVPYIIGAGTANVQVQTVGGSSSVSQIQVVQTAPAVVTANNRSVVINQDGSLNSASNPARVGSTVVVYFVGIGPVNANVTSGAGSPLATSTLPSSVTIGGVFAPVTYIGLSPGSVGLAQANVQIPSLPAGDQQLVINIGGVSSVPALIAVAP